MTDLITEAMVDAALDEWYPGEDWRTILPEPEHHPRAQMRAALLAAERAAWQTDFDAMPTGSFVQVFGTYEGRARQMVASASVMREARNGRVPSHLSLRWATRWRPLPAPPEGEG